MARKIVFLMSDKHVNHLMNIEHDGEVPVEEENGGILLPEGANVHSLYCIECDEMLREGWDFFVQDFYRFPEEVEKYFRPRPPDKELMEPWEEDPEEWKK